MLNEQPHLLQALSLPSRYEPLVAQIGPEVLNLLMPPSGSTIEVLEEAAEAVRSLGEGLFLPIHAEPGTGKTTLAENLTVFLPKLFTKTITYEGALDAAMMRSALERFTSDGIAANENRVIPMNVDHREGKPATQEEMSEIKRFLRQGPGQRVLLVWPGTYREHADSMAATYRAIAGVVPLDLPIHVDGPPSSSWTDLASQTLQLANGVDSLEDIVDLDRYDPATFKSLGDFLKQIAIDFNKEKLRLERATVKPMRMTILIVSETAGHGVLSTLTSSRRHGMLDPTALLQASGTSVIGKWWAGHRGLLVQTIVALDAHVFAVAPPLSLAVLRRYGPEEVTKSLSDLGYALRTPADVSTYLGRSDFGRYLAGEQRAIGEMRGNPAEDARQVFEAFEAYVGFQGGGDKKLNAAFALALTNHAEAAGLSVSSISSEKAVGFMPQIIPDVALYDEQGVHCVEFTYRKGDYVQAKNRSAIAQYCLNKLKNYARGLGWLAADD